MRSWAIVLWSLFAIIAGAAVAVAQAPSPITQRVQAAVPSRVQAVDPLVQLRAQVQSLASRVTQLQSRVDTLEVSGKGAASVIFQCVDPVTSKASNGVMESCSPYGCDGQIGRCRKTAATSNDCAAGYSWCSIYNSCATTEQCR